MKLSKFTKKFVTINSVAMLLSAGVPVLQPQLTGPSIVHAASTDDSGVSEWNDWGTVKWGIDSNGTLWIKPQSGTEGTTGDFGGEIAGNTIKKNTVPWYSKAASIKSVRMKGTVNAYDCAFLFAGLTNCTDIDVSNLKTDSADSMLAMFAEDVNLEKITGLDKFNTSNVTKIGWMFQNCHKLTNLDVSKWDTSKVTDMRYTFDGCESLTTIPISDWDTSLVTSLFATFNNCSSLTTLDVSKWNISNVTSMYYTFQNCKSLTTIPVSNWDTGQVTDMNRTFAKCSSLSNLDVSKWNTFSATDMAGMFNSCSSLANLDTSKWNTSQVTDMSWMFNGCKSLTTLDVSKWDTSKVTNMSVMFLGCTKLNGLNVSNWDIGQVTGMSYMFCQCPSLTNLDVSKWNTGNVTDMYGMFSGSSSLANLDVSKWNTSKVTDMGWMFVNCKTLKVINVSNWNTSAATNMNSMFSGCSNLTNLDMSNWDTSKVTDIGWMFANCSKLSELKLGKDFTIPSGQDTGLPDPVKTGGYTGRWSKADGSNGMSAKEMLSLTGQEHDASGKSLNKTLDAHDRAGTWVWERGYTITINPNIPSSYTLVGKIKTYTGALSQDQTYDKDSVNIYIENPGYKVAELDSVVCDDYAAEKTDGTGTKYPYSSTIKASGDMTIYNQWKFTGYLIKYDANGGHRIDNDDDSLTDDVSVIQPISEGDSITIKGNPSFTRKGYQFNNWSDDIHPSSKSNIYLPGQSITPTSDLILYAQWKGIPYAVKFDANGGSGSMDNESFVYGTYKKLTKNSFTRKSYKFTGWNSKADGSGKTYSDEESINNLSDNGQTVTLYAQWKKADWSDSGMDKNQTKSQGDSDSMHDAGTYVLTIPTKIKKSGIKAGKINYKTSYDVNVTGNIPDNSYVHVTAKSDKKLIGKSDELDLSVDQGKQVWSANDAYGTDNPDGSITGVTGQDTAIVSGTVKTVDTLNGLIVYSASMDNSEKAPIDHTASYGNFNIKSVNKKAVETYEDSDQLGFTAGTKLHSDLTGTSYQWSINGKNIPGATDADYVVTDADLKTGETDGKFQSNKLECIVTKADGTKETAYVYLAVPLTYSSTTNVDLKRTLTDNGNIAYEGYTMSNGANVGYGYTNCGWRVPASAISFKATDKFMPSQMFMFAYGASKLETFDATNIDTSQVTNMQDLFYLCDKIQTLDVSGWDVSKVSDNFILAFGSMTSLKTLKGIENWDTQSAINMQSMFFMDSNLSADLSGWNVSKVNINLNFNYGANKVIAPKWHG